MNERKRRVRKNEKQIGGEIYWTACKAAEYLGVSKATLYILARNGLSYYKPRSIYYFKEDWLKQFINYKSIEKEYGKEAR
jgi:excisionase family DNA binding protein